MNRIIWTRWKDPLSPLVKGKAYEGYRPEEDEHDADFRAARDGFGGGDEGAAYPRPDGKVGFTGPAIVNSVLGVIPLYESTLPGVLFNFWVADTTFDLTRSMRDIIARVPGVETLDVVTRYRFRLGVGRAFDERVVKQAIEQAVQPKSVFIPLPAPKADGLDAVKSMLAKRYAYWAIFVMPKGAYQFVGGNTFDEVREKVKGYDGRAERTILSWENQ